MKPGSATPEAARESTPEARVLEGIRLGMQRRDAGLLAGLYAEQCECTVVNRNNPPSKPLILRGRAEIRRLFDDICGREMTHEVTRMLAGNGAASFSLRCRYPDGCTLVAMSMLTIEAGLIVSELSVDCWDE